MMLGSSPSPSLRPPCRHSWRVVVALARDTGDFTIATTRPLIDVPPESEPELGVTQWAVDLFREAYGRDDIDRDDIFAYSYGVMHCSVWRSTYEHELQRQMPRVPLAADFDAFRDAGAELLTLHADYEVGPQNLDVTLYLGDEAVECDAEGEPTNPLPDAMLRIVRPTGSGGGGSPDWTLDGKRLSSLAKASERLYDVRLAINGELSLGDFPDGTFGYQVSGRTPLEWAQRYLEVKENKQTGLLNDANAYERWADDPFELVRYFRRLVHVSVQSTAIISSLPNSLEGQREMPPAFAPSDRDRPVDAVHPNRKD